MKKHDGCLKHTVLYLSQVEFRYWLVRKSEGQLFKCYFKCNFSRSSQVVFVKREDAEMAVKKYNSRELDGQPMQCKMVSPAAKPATKANEEPLLGGRLKPAKQVGEGGLTRCN